MDNVTEQKCGSTSAGAFAGLKLNRVVAWTSFAFGVGSGLILGLWSFDGPVAVPAWLGDYGDTSRRLARLGHIAFFGIGILNLFLVAEIRQLSSGFTGRKAALGLMNFGNVFLPLSLIAAAALRPLKYFMALPAISIFAALIITVWGVCQAKESGDANC